MRHFWRAERQKTVSSGGDEALATVRDDQQRVYEALGPLRPGKKPAQASVDSLAPGSRPKNTGLAELVMPHATSTGSAGAPGCILK